MSTPSFATLSLPMNVLSTLQKGGIEVAHMDSFGPRGVTMRVQRTSDGEYGSIVITQAPRSDGNEWLHASLAWRNVMPSYDELQLLHRAVFGRRRYSYQVFAPESQHVNIHEHALHLFGRVDGTDALLDFTEGSGSI